MSKIAKNSIKLSKDINCSFENGILIAKGKLGELTQDIDINIIIISIQENEIVLTREKNNKESRSLHGLYRSLLANMVHGVSEGYEKKLELVGVGYKATNQGQKLDLSVGFSHNIIFDIPEEVKLSTEMVKGEPPVVILNSIDKQLIGLVAAKIRSFRKPEPYKGKGIRYAGEYIRRKAGKTAAA